jgi:hypothetical protein
MQAGPGNLRARYTLKGVTLPRRLRFPGQADLRSGSACARTTWPELTTTVTATATVTGYQQRPATAHNARTIRANLGIRPA